MCIYGQNFITTLVISTKLKKKVTLLPCKKQRGIERHSHTNKPSCNWNSIIKSLLYLLFFLKIASRFGLFPLLFARLHNQFLCVFLLSTHHNCFYFDAQSSGGASSKRVGHNFEPHISTHINLPKWNLGSKLKWFQDKYKLIHFSALQIEMLLLSAPCSRTLNEKLIILQENDAHKKREFAKKNKNRTNIKFNRNI